MQHPTSLSQPTDSPSDQKRHGSAGASPSQRGTNALHKTHAPHPPCGHLLPTGAKEIMQHPTSLSQPVDSPSDQKRQRLSRSFALPKMEVVDGKSVGLENAKPLTPALSPLRGARENTTRLAGPAVWRTRTRPTVGSARIGHRLGGNRKTDDHCKQ